MKLFKDSENNIYAYEEDGSQDHLIESKTPITKAEADEIIQAKVEASINAMSYAEKRVAKYPSFADQFDLLYHGGYDAWKAAIDAIKTQYPKP
jgi:hypothetical protein